ncbi:MAG: 50S ribosomal protein L3 N(5)-glutamine methyltransferase [Proteobacteria bacterium]|nr:50S ribosomal protein L3 N(5)-glutamine methyltransferase [Pseudomonadota bacterium]
MTLRELIHRTKKQFLQADLFYGHGTDNALDEAFYLVMVTLDLEFDCNEEQLNQTLTTDQIKKVEGLINKRINEHIPVAYLVNQAWFAGYKFYVNKNVLIPRSPLAELITSDFQPWVKPESVKSIIDIGTGSACIAIACAHQFKHASIDAVDIDDAAIQVANKNVELHQLDSRVKIIKSDLFEKLSDKKYNLIISNPPYVSHAEMQTLPKEYSHEPGHALVAENDGLAIIDKILRQSVKHLTDEGVLIVEVGNCMQAVDDNYPDLPLTWLEFEHGGNGVFLISRAELEQSKI